MGERTAGTQAAGRQLLFAVRSARWAPSSSNRTAVHVLLPAITFIEDHAQRGVNVAEVPGHPLVGATRHRAGAQACRGARERLEALEAALKRREDDT